MQIKFTLNPQQDFDTFKGELEKLDTVQVFTDMANVAKNTGATSVSIGLYYTLDDSDAAETCHSPDNVSLTPPPA